MFTMVGETGLEPVTPGLRRPGHNCSVRYLKRGRPASRWYQTYMHQLDQNRRASIQG